MKRKTLPPKPADASPALPSPDDALLIDAEQYQRNRLRDVPQAALDEYMGLACALGLPPLYREVETEIFPVVRKWCPGMTKAEWSKMEYVERVPYLRRALAALEAPPATPAPPDGPWSKPDSPARWAKVFGFTTPRTFTRHVTDGKIRAKKLSDKLYQIHVDDIPKPQK